MVDVCFWVITGLDLDVDSNYVVGWSKESEGIYFPLAPPLIYQVFLDNISFSIC